MLKLNYGVPLLQREWCRMALTQPQLMHNKLFEYIKALFEYIKALFPQVGNFFTLAGYRRFLAGFSRLSATDRPGQGLPHG